MRAIDAMRGAMARTSVHGSMRASTALSSVPTNGSRVQMKDKSFMCQVRRRAKAEGRETATSTSTKRAGGGHTCFDGVCRIDWMRSTRHG